MTCSQSETLTDSRQLNTSKSVTSVISDQVPVSQSASEYESGRSIRHYNSTPDCKNLSLLCSSSRRKK